MKIRKAKLADREEVLELYNLFVGEDRYSRGTGDSFALVLKSRSNIVFVAEEERILIGFSAFSIRRVIRYPAPIAELDELFVHPDYRQLGIGRQLMLAVLQQAKRMNCCRLYIESQYKHSTGHKLYESLGFTNYGYHFLMNL